MNQPFDHVIASAADREQSCADPIHGLMVGGVYKRTVSIELIEEIPSAKAAVVDGVTLVAACPLMPVRCIDVLPDTAAEMHIDKLESFADAKHRLFLGYKAGQDLQLQDIKSCVDVV